MSNILKRAGNIISASLHDGHYDYTQGSIRYAIVLLAIPMILELGLESVFAVVDMFFVGKLPNADNAIATVGLTESVMTLVYTIGIGLSVGATAIVARRVGEKNDEEAARSGMQAIILSIIIAIIIGIIGVVFAKQILLLLGANAAVANTGKTFTQILFASSPSIILLFLINGIFRGAGNATMAMKSLWLASGVNIILCPILIFGIGFIKPMGLNGAALATAIGRTCGVLFQCYFLLKGKGIIKIRRSYITLNKENVMAIFKVAGPATLQFFIQSGSWIVMTYFVATTGGTEASAGYQIAIRNIIFFILPAWGISNAAATLVGQNLGAGQVQRAEQSAMLTAKYNIVFMVLVTLLFVFFSTEIISLFTNEKVLIAYGSKALRIIGYGYSFYGIGMVMVQSLNGAGDTTTPTYINIVSFWLLQIPLAWLLAGYLKMGPTGVFIAIPISETVLAILAWYYFKRGKWKELKV
jgi:putative MATE family efflux protein